MSDQPSNKEAEGIASEIREAHEITNRNIERFLELQAKEQTNLIMVAHQQDILNVAEVAAAAAELTNANIRRFLNLQKGERAALIMVAHDRGLKEPE